MNTMVLQGAALVLMLLALPLASFGTTSGATWANVAAIGVLTVGGLIPPVLRYLGDDEDEEPDADERDETTPEEEDA
ncbi:MAG: hypothetical protein H5T83_12790 [Actinotalea sp.]|nr:hypothetical protein [Actinotalea sp.]